MRSLKLPALELLSAAAAVERLLAVLPSDPEAADDGFAVLPIVTSAVNAVCGR